MLDNDKLWRNTKMALNVTMGLVYIFIGMMIIWKEWFMTPLEPIFSWSLGVVLILYGLLRVYRIYQHKNE